MKKLVGWLMMEEVERERERTGGKEDVYTCRICECDVNSEVKRCQGGFFQHFC